MTSHVVTSALVNARVKDAAGTYVLRGFYAGAVLPDDVHPDDLSKLARKNMIAEQGTPEADAASPVGQRVEFDEGGMPVTPKPGPAAKPGPKPPAAKPAAPQPRAS